MEQRKLPGVRDVITKLRSDGIFDNFRKSCVNSIENEPLFRSQKEEVEVLSRRFLQRGHWDDKALKSDVRVQLRSYVLEVLDRPEAISQLGFIAEKILSRKHQEFMEQISSVTTSLQESLEESHYKNERSSNSNLEREKVKTTETAEDLLQSFAISSSAVTKKIPPPKPVKLPRTDHPHNVATKEDTGKHSTTSKSADQDDTVSVTKPKRDVKPLKHHRFVISSSEESDGEQATDEKAVNPPPLSPDNGRSFTARLHATVYPGVKEQAEVTWSDKATPQDDKQADNTTDTKHYQWSYNIHPAVPWVRRKSLYKAGTTDNITSDSITADDSAVSDNAPYDSASSSDDNILSDKAAAGEKDFKEDCSNVMETEPRHSSRIKKRKLGHHPSSDSEGERAAGRKKIKLDTPPPIDEAIDSPGASTPTGTRTSKRVRRAPVKLRQ